MTIFDPPIRDSSVRPEGSTYELVEGESVHGHWYAVIERIDGRATGADHHWLRRDSAERALAAYEAGTVRHPSKVTDFIRIP